jgi:hypothetical protein
MNACKKYYHFCVVYSDIQVRKKEKETFVEGRQRHESSNPILLYFTVVVLCSGNVTDLVSSVMWRHCFGSRRIPELLKSFSESLCS